MDQKIKALLLRNLLSFTRKAIFEKDGIKIGREPYLAYVADHLEAFARGDPRRLIINLPPSHLKSQLGAVCLALWLWANDPTLEILLITHTEQLSASHARDIRSIVMSGWYQELCGVRIKQGHASLTDFGNNFGGRIMSVSFAGNFTGLHSDVIIVDDAHDISDTPRQIEHTVSTFYSKCVTRLKNPNGPILVIQHRVHEADLSGCLLREKTWSSVVLPLVAPRDQIYETKSGIWHRRQGDFLRSDYSPEFVDKLRNSCFNPDFEMLFQQDCEAAALPSFKADHFPRFRYLPPSNSPIVFSVDPGAGSKPNSAFSVIQTWRVEAQRYCLIDQFREQCEYTMLRDNLRRFLKRYRPVAILIERAANGNALISELMRKHRYTVVPIDPDGRSKSARLRAHAQTILDGRIHLPLYAPWADDYVAELVGFRQFRRTVFTDQIDATTQFLDHVHVFASLKSRPMIPQLIMKAGYRTRVFAAPGTGRPGIIGRSRREPLPLHDPIFDLPPKPGS